MHIWGVLGSLVHDIDLVEQVWLWVPPAKKNTHVLKRVQCWKLLEITALEHLSVWGEAERAETAQPGEEKGHWGHYKRA